MKVVPVALCFVSAVLFTAASGHAGISQSVGDDGVISISGSGSKTASSGAPASASFSRYPRRAGGASRYDEYIRQAAALYQIPEPLVRAVITVESGFDPRAVSRTNARGLMQLMPQTAERMMVTDIFDPRQNIFGGVRYLRVLANLFNGDIQLTVAGYNAGEGAVFRYGGIPPYEETQGYVVKVLEHYRRYKDQAADGH
jgi:soluble lytic murein transglycosylase-like protein